MYAMGPGFDTEYFPDAKRAAIYQQRYIKYKQLGYFLEQQTNNPIVSEKSKPALQTS
jgi:L-ribulokinase